MLNCLRLAAMGPLVLLLASHVALDAADEAPAVRPRKAGSLIDSPEVALRKVTVAPGLQVDLFAAEPDVRQPIAMCWDERGRLWIAENYTYSDGKERYDLNLRDRILILEDSDHDGKFDKRMKASLAPPQVVHWTQYLEGLKVVMAAQAQAR